MYRDTLLHNAGLNCLHELTHQQVPFTLGCQLLHSISDRIFSAQLKLIYALSNQLIEVLLRHHYGDSLSPWSDLT